MTDPKDIEDVEVYLTEDQKRQLLEAVIAGTGGDEAMSVYRASLTDNSVETLQAAVTNAMLNTAIVTLLQIRVLEEQDKIKEGEEFVDKLKSIST